MRGSSRRGRTGAATEPRSAFCPIRNLVSQPKRDGHRPALPSLNFLLLLLIFTGTGGALWQGIVGGRFPIFVFVVAGWVVSLCLMSSAMR